MLGWATWAAFQRRGEITSWEFWRHTAWVDRLACPTLDLSGGANLVFALLTRQTKQSELLLHTVSWTIQWSDRTCDYYFMITSPSYKRTCEKHFVGWWHPFPAKDLAQWIGMSDTGAFWWRQSCFFALLSRFKLDNLSFCYTWITSLCRINLDNQIIQQDIWIIFWKMMTSLSCKISCE